MMAFFGLFQSREERDREAKLRFRQGKSRIQRFLQQAQDSAERYWQLARQAYRLGDQEQLRQLAANFYRTRESINRWERFLLKMDALEMRRNEVEATGDFVRGMNALTATILRGSTPEEVSRMQLDVERAIAKAEQQEELLTSAMDSAGNGILSTTDLTDEALDQFLQGIDKHARQAEMTETPGFLQAMTRLNQPDTLRSVTGN
jgi:hypothetical protein